MNRYLILLVLSLPIYQLTARSPAKTAIIKISKQSYSSTPVTIKPKPRESIQSQGSIIHNLPTQEKPTPRTIIQEYTNRVDLSDKDFTGKDSGGNSALHSAIKMNNTNMMVMLLNANFDPNAKNFAGETPLHLAVLKGDIAKTTILINARANPNIASRIGLTPLHLLAISPNSTLPMAQLLMNAGANQNMKTVTGLTPLHFIVSKPVASPDDEKITQLLLNATDNNIQDIEGSTPCIKSVRALNKTSCRSLIDAQVNINQPDYKGMTPLHWAIFKGNDTITAMFIAAQANINARTHKGQTPLDLAKTLKRTNIIELLINAGAE